MVASGFPDLCLPPVKEAVPAIYADPRRIHDVLTVRLTNLRYFISQLRDALFDGILHRDRLLQLRVFRFGFLQDWNVGSASFQRVRKSL